MVIVLQVISKCLIRHYSEMSIVSIFLDIRKCSPEDSCAARYVVVSAGLLLP